MTVLTIFHLGKEVRGTKDSCRCTQDNKQLYNRFSGVFLPAYSELFHFFTSSKNAISAERTETTEVAERTKTEWH